MGDKIAKVSLNGQTLIDISEDSVTPEVLAEDETAHDAAGEPIRGTAQFGGDTTDCYKTTDTADTTIADGDYLPFNDISDENVPKKKITLTNLINKLKNVLAPRTDVYQLAAGKYTALIQENDDLNDYVTGGTYDCLNRATALTLSNCPIGGAFKLRVDVENNPNILTQTIVTKNLNLNTNPEHTLEFIRTRDSESIWGEWYQVAGRPVSATNDSKFYRHDGQWNVPLLDSARTLTTADMNNITEPGYYYHSQVNYTNITNAPPVNDSYWYWVVDSNNGDRKFFKQIAFARATNTIYQRNKSGENASWSDWNQLASIDDISPSSVGDGYAEGTVNGSAITATISGFKLRPGVIVAIKINSEMTSACTLNINNTGAKSVKYWGNDDPTNGKPIGANHITTYMYDGTYYRVLSKDRTPAVGPQSYVADTSGNIVLDWGYGSDRSQLKHNIGLGRLMYNFYKNSAWRGDKQLVDVTGNQTMEGWLKLPAGSGMTVASGAHRPAAQDTIPNIISELRYSNGAWGSFNLGTAYTLNYTTIPTGWYNYFYIPHRVGGENWATPTSWDTDNVNYGTLMLFGMNNSNGMFRIRWHWGNSAIQIDELEDLQKGNMYVGICSTAADQRAKSPIVDGNFVLRKGVRVAIKFTYTNTYSSSTDNPITLNVNNTGAKNIYYGTTHSGAGNAGINTRMYGVANRYIYYLYDGNYWVWDGCGVDDNTTYSVITADQISAGTDTASSVVRADYLKTGIRNVMDQRDYVPLVRLRLKEIDIPDNSGYPKYLLLKEVTEWYNSTTTGQKTQGFSGWLIARRQNGSLCNYICEIKALVSWQKETSPSSSGGKGVGEFILESTHDFHKPCVLKDSNNKYYLAIRCTGSGRQAVLFGTWVHDNDRNTGWTGYVGTWVNCTDSNGTLPSGYSKPIDGRGNSSPVKNITRSNATFTATRQDDTTFTFNHSFGTIYGTCTSAADARIKEVTVSDTTWYLRPGLIVHVKFTNTNTYNSQTANPIQLNVNGTGAKNIWYNAAHSGSGNTGTNTRIYGEANRTFTYMYDGTYWVWLGCGYEADTTDPRNLGFGLATCDTAAATAAKVATLSSYNLKTGGYVTVKFTYDVPANATLNINTRGAKAIYYRGAAITAGKIKAGDRATFVYNGTQYELVSNDRWGG